ncbi:MAG: hypothetical protein AB3N18_09305 [Allomuricauda sp.]
MSFRTNVRNLVDSRPVPQLKLRSTLLVIPAKAGIHPECHPLQVLSVAEA